MRERGRIIGLGAAYIDAKIWSSKLSLPSDKNKLPAFLDAHPEAELYPGGSIPNILTTFIRLSSSPNARLFCCVGNDARGEFYTDHTDSSLGKPQVSLENPTGVWVGIYNNGLVENSDFYGAAGDIAVSREELEAERNEAFITDIDACKAPEALDSVGQILNTLREDGLFILSLSGSDPNQNIRQLLTFIERKPDIVFGNVHELLNIVGDGDVKEHIKVVFSESDLVVITLGEEGAIMRVRGRIFSVPAKYIPLTKAVDVSGAGDAYTGAMLALLLPIGYEGWKEYDVVNAAKVASYTSSLVVQRKQSRLSIDDAQLVLNYIGRGI